MEVADGDRGHAAAKADDIDRRTVVGCRPVPQLAVPVVAPALDAACARERAAKSLAGGDGADADKARNGDRGAVVGVVPSPSWP